MREIARTRRLRGTLQLAALMAGATACAAAPGAHARDGSLASARPNIVLIVADDLGWRDVGFMGSAYYETPNIDRLAREGMIFTEAYANAPNCAPTRASLMTGQYTPRHGIYTVGTAERGAARDRKLIPTSNRQTLPSEALTLAESLREAGYATAHVGKWHLGDPPRHGPEAQGFDVNVGGNRSGHPQSYFAPYVNPQIQDGPEGEYLTDRLTREAVTFIDASRNRPFFLYLPYYAVHTPLQAKQELVEKYRRKPGSNGQDNPVYAAMIESMDTGVGQVLDRLKALGLADNTVVIFTSDNGGHGNVTSNAPLRGSKGMFYEGGIRVPQVVWWPGVTSAGSSTGDPVITTDFFPTLLEIAGAPRPDGWVLDGASLVPLLRGEGRLPPRALYWHFPAYLEPYRGQAGWRATPSSVIRQGDWKLIETFEDGRLELYNLEDDLGETTDLAQRQPDRARELHAALSRWRESVNAPIPRQLNPDHVTASRPATAPGAAPGSRLRER